MTQHLPNPFKAPKLVKMAALAVIAPVVIGGAIAFSGGSPQASAQCLFTHWEGPGLTITTIAFCDHGTYVF